MVRGLVFIACSFPFSMEIVIGVFALDATTARLHAHIAITGAFESVFGNFFIREAASKHREAVRIVHR